MKNNQILTHFERIILNAFAARFAQSAQRRGGRKIRISDWNKFAPEIYFKAEEKIRFLDALAKLHARDVISIKWKRFRTNEEVEAVYLESGKLLYHALGIKHPDDILMEIADAVSQKKTHTLISQRIIDYCKKMLDEKIDLPFDNPHDVNNILDLIDYIDVNGMNLPIRALSVKLFHSSKKIEQLLSGLKNVLKHLGEEKLVENLERAFPECMIKGTLLIEFNDGRSWELRGEAVSFSLGSADKIKKITDSKLPMRAMLSVENKETFYLIDKPDTYCGYIFCHGHVNEAVKTIISTAYNSGMSIHHFGDMDPDGILIYTSIHDLCGGSSKPYMMDRIVYEKYLEYGYDLSPAQLSRIPDSAVHMDDLIKSIKHHRKGIEQEIIDIL